MGCKAKKYSDGGKVVKDDYGPGTYWDAFKDRTKATFGLGAKKVADAAVTGVKKAPVTGESLNAIAKHRKELDDA